MEVGQVRVLTLNIGENLQEKLFRLEKGNINIIMLLSFSVTCICNFGPAHEVYLYAHV